MSGLPPADVTVVLPTIRTDAWFAAAVASVLAQRDVALRLLVVLDGVARSADAWWDDPRVEVLALPVRRGLVHGLRAAFARVTTPYVARLDADDLAEPTRLARQLGYLAAHPDVGLLGCEALRIDADGAEVGPFGAATGDDIRPALLRSNPVVHSAVVLRTAAYHRAGGFDPRMDQMEDYDLWLRIAQHERVAALPEPLVRYRLHGGQVSRGAKPWGHHIRTIRRQRLALARSLGAPVVRTALTGTAWEAAQVLRYAGLRRPGYDAGSPR